jgi:hypothetical protein
MVSRILIFIILGAVCKGGQKYVTDVPDVSIRQNTVAT